MKKVKIVLIALLICLLFSGCSTFRLSSIDDLITPVSPSGDDAGIIAAVNNYCNGGYSIKIPSSGKYTTSFISYDLDDSGTDEAIAFFEPADKLGTVDMAVIRKNDDGWKVVNSIAGEGSDVNCVEFCDINNDDKEEIIVGWRVLSNSATSNLCVYSVNDGFELELLADSISAGDFICADINNDSTNEILVLNLGSNSESPKAELYSFISGDKNRIGQTKLDNTIMSFSSIVCSETDSGIRVYADAVKSNGDSMVTELLYWSDYYNSIISPFYSYNSGKTRETSRNNMIISRDINNDEFIEIPVDKSVKGLPNQISAQNWVAYDNTVLNHRAYSVACKRDGYLIVIDDDLLDELTFSYDEEKRELSADYEDKQAFKILTVIKSSYNSSDYKDYSEIFSDSGFVYLAAVHAESEITIDDLKSNIRPY